MTNIKKFISCDWAIALLLCVCFFGLNADVAAQKGKAKSKSAVKSSATSKSAKKKQVDLTLTPVVLIHGIGGSDLDYQPKGMWRNGFPNDVLKGTAGDPQNLQFNADGLPRDEAGNISKFVRPVGFYDVPMGKNITDLSKFLERNGYAKNTNLFEFAYDFRFSAVYNAAELEKFIGRIQSENRVEKFDIVAHSMGGMVAKQYLMNEANQRNVRNLIFVGTPHLGAPKALKALRYGDDLDVFLIDGCKLKRAAHNFPGMFNLLPGKRYFEASGGGYFEDDADIDSDKVRGVLDFEQMTNNLFNGEEKLCPLRADIDAPPLKQLAANLVLEHTIKFHDAQDDWEKPDNIKVFMLVGFGNPTLKMLSESSAQLKLTYTTAGDGTVPLWSAETADADEIYYMDLTKLKTDHSQMIGEARVNAQILNLLQRGKIGNLPGFSKSRPDKKAFQETVKITEKAL